MDDETDWARERTLYAAERTLSAWMRTGLTSVGAGFAILRFFIVGTGGSHFALSVVGHVLILTGVFIMGYSLMDYRESVRKLGHVDRKNSWWIITVIVVFIAISLLILVGV